MFVGFDTLGAHHNTLACFANHNSSFLEIGFPVSEHSLVRVTNFHSNNFAFSTFVTSLHDNLQAQKSTKYTNCNLKYEFRSEYATTA